MNTPNMDIIRTHDTIQAEIRHLDNIISNCQFELDNIKDHRNEKARGLKRTIEHAMIKVMALNWLYNKDILPPSNTL